MKVNFNPQIDSKLAYFPQKYAAMAIGFYLISLCACSVIFSGHSLPFLIFTIGILSIILFFIGSYQLGHQWRFSTEKKFIRHVFITALVIRLIYIYLAYVYNEVNYNTYYESNAGDIHFYVPTAMQALHDHGLNLIQIVRGWQTWNLKIPDIGYMIYLVLVIGIIGGSGAPIESNPDIAGQSYIWFPLILKAIWGAWTCILMYRVAQRHFGENVARMTALFCALQWNMIWWCGSMMKETEMVFLSTLYVERMDRIIMGINIRPVFIAITVVIGLALFTFRSALFMTGIAATMLALMLTHSRTLTTGKKVLAGLMVSGAFAFAIGDTIKEEFSSIKDTVQDTEYQKTNMEWRATGREHSNSFAKYATTAVFAPLIFTIPFPTMVYTHQGQEMLMLAHGGNFEKNVLSFFIIFAMFQLLLSGQWRQHVFLIAYYIGYLAALALSVFAQSGRFHMPIMPFAMLFGAYGLTLVTSHKHKQWFTYALLAEVAICIFWSWFKLKGQGLI